MNQHINRLYTVAALPELYPISLAQTWLREAAQYLEAHEDLANEYRRKAEIQIALRVEAQARAGRLSREARR